MIRALVIAVAIALGGAAMASSLWAAPPPAGEVEEAVSFDDEESVGDEAAVTPVVVLETETQAALAWLPVVVLGLFAINVGWRRS